MFPQSPNSLTGVANALPKFRCDLLSSSGDSLASACTQRNRLVPLICFLFLPVITCSCPCNRKPSAFSAAYAALLRRRKLDGPTFHALRHAHALHLRRSGVDVKVISARLGHSKTGFTMDTYIHLLPGQQEEAAAKIEEAMNAARGKLPKYV
ncbi:MAG: tyrosine-type recombinase/integrase [Bryobacteraceae bacterium]